MTANQRGPSEARLRVGTLGAARITPAALLRPSRKVAEVQVVAVAARDRDRAATFAARHGIDRVLGSYEELVADPGIDAVYVPLPNGLHGQWTMAALEAGKHVLCEKPFTANAAEAATVAEVAAHSGRVCMEAFHYRYHPLARRMSEIVASGELGRIERIETSMCIPLPLPGDIRYDAALAGGAMMDVGAYAVHMLRILAGSEPVVTSARAKLSGPGVDRAMAAELELAGGAAATLRCSLWSSRLFSIRARVRGADAEMVVFNPTVPQLLHRLTVRDRRGRTRHEQFPRTPTYVYQLRAFADATLRGGRVETPPEDSVANMAVIDAVYVAAGMEPRRPTR